MSARSVRKTFLSAAVAGVLSVAVLTAAAEQPRPAKYSVPRNEYGQPELRGVWNFSSDTPLERPAQFKDREFMTPEEAAKLHRQIEERSEASDAAAKNTATQQRDPGGYNQFWVESLAQQQNLRTSLIVDPPNGRMPPMIPGTKVEAGGLGPDTGGVRPVRFRVGGVRKDGPEDRGLSERCIAGFNSGPPFMPSMYNNNVQIFQSKDTAVIMTEMIHDARVVKLEKQRPALDQAIEQWSGDSRGYYEGDTLVVETRHFTDKTQSFRAAGSGKNLHLTERFTRVGKDRVDYKFTIDDAQTFTQPVTVLVPMIRADGELYEYACHEGNYGMKNMLSGARQEEREAAGKK